MEIFMNGRIEVKVGDITKEEVDAIVNAANSSLMGGGGVDGAIHRAGGSQIYMECKKLKNARFPQGLPTSEAVATTAGNLNARYVIHAVGPVWYGGLKNELKQLSDTYKNSLKIAKENNCKTVAFPAISTGIYKFPKNLAAKISSSVVKDFLEENESIEKVMFVFFRSEDADIFIEENVFEETQDS